jgi:CheY-like chemotaxis protein
MAAPSPADAAPTLKGRPLRVMVDLPPASTLACVAALVRSAAKLATDVGEADLVILDAALPPAQIQATAKRRRTLVVLRPSDRSRIEQFRQMGCAGYLIRPLRSASIVERVGLSMLGAVQSEPRSEEPKPGEAGAVLIADDNAVNVLLARKALLAAGFRVDTAGTGAEALERLGDTDYSVIFMDIRMPVMDGLEATRRIRRLSGPAGETPIVALTADVDPDLEEAARKAGVSQLAAKPIDPQRLRELAQSWANRRKQAAE